MTLAAFDARVGKVDKERCIRLRPWMTQMPSFRQEGAEVTLGNRCLVVAPTASQRQIDGVVFYDDTDPNELVRMHLARHFAV